MESTDLETYGTKGESKDHAMKDDACPINIGIRRKKPMELRKYTLVMTR